MKEEARGLCTDRSFQRYGTMEPRQLHNMYAFTKWSMYRRCVMACWPCCWRFNFIELFLDQMSSFSCRELDAVECWKSLCWQFFQMHVLIMALALETRLVWDMSSVLSFTFCLLFWFWRLVFLSSLIFSTHHKPVQFCDLTGCDQFWENIGQPLSTTSTKYWHDCGCKIHMGWVIICGYFLTKCWCHPDFCLLSRWS